MLLPLTFLRAYACCWKRRQSSQLITRFEICGCGFLHLISLYLQLIEYCAATPGVIDLLIAQKADILSHVPKILWKARVSSVFVRRLPLHVLLVAKDLTSSLSY